MNLYNVVYILTSYNYKGYIIFLNITNMMSGRFYVNFTSSVTDEFTFGLPGVRNSKVNLNRVGKKNVITGHMIYGTFYE